ncbi:MAG: response regulator [Proteobacteria bacterium]|nr:response regulator [Pseudomonadota bacterium]
MGNISVEIPDELERRLAALAAARGTTPAALLPELLERAVRMRGESLAGSAGTLDELARRAQRMEALGALAGGLAGEFAGAIATIDGHLKLARQDARRNARVLRSLAVCSRASRSAAALARQVLAFSHGEPQGPKPLALGTVVEDAASLLRASVPPGLDVEFRAAPDLPTVRADEALVQHAVVSAGIRAVRALAGRGGVIEIEVEAVPGSGGAPGAAEVRVRGLPRADAADAAVAGVSLTTQAEPGGGLEVLGELVAALGATLSPTAGNGVGVALRFPVVAPADGAGEPRSRNKTERRVQPPGGGERVLFVDDHKWLLVLVERLLLERGYRAATYTTGAAALEALHAEPDGFDVIVTDYKMPGATGLDIIRAVKAVRPDLPVVLVSGYASDKVAQQAKRVGADAVLSKQTLATDLLPLLAKVLARAAAAPGER